MEAFPFTVGVSQLRRVLASVFLILQDISCSLSLGALCVSLYLSVRLCTSLYPFLPLTLPPSPPCSFHSIKLPMWTSLQRLSAVSST